VVTKIVAQREDAMKKMENERAEDLIRNGWQITCLNSGWESGMARRGVAPWPLQASNVQATAEAQRIVFPSDMTYIVEMN